MGKEARIGLLLGAAACLLAETVDWVVEELWASPRDGLRAGFAPAGGRRRVRIPT